MPFKITHQNILHFNIVFMRATCSAQLIIISLIITAIFSEEDKSRSASCHFLFLRPCVLFSTPFSRTLEFPCSSLNVKYHASNPNKTIDTSPRIFFMFSYHVNSNYIKLIEVFALHNLMGSLNQGVPQTPGALQALLATHLSTVFMQFQYLRVCV